MNQKVKMRNPTHKQLNKKNVQLKVSVHHIRISTNPFITNMSSSGWDNFDPEEKIIEKTVHKEEELQVIMK